MDCLAFLSLSLAICMPRVKDIKFCSVLHFITFIEALNRAGQEGILSRDRFKSDWLRSEEYYGW